MYVYMYIYIYIREGTITKSRYIYIYLYIREGTITKSRRKGKRLYKEFIEQKIF